MLRKMKSLLVKEAAAASVRINPIRPLVTAMDVTV